MTTETTQKKDYVGGKRGDGGDDDGDGNDDVCATGLSRTTPSTSMSAATSAAVGTATATTKTNPDVDAAPTSNDDRESTTMEIVLFDNTVSTVMKATAKMAVMTTVKIAVTKLAAQQR